MRRLSSLLAILLSVASAAITAQVARQGCDTCYRYFTYDSTLRLGGHQISDVEIAEDGFAPDNIQC